MSDVDDEAPIEVAPGTGATGLVQQDDHAAATDAVDDAVAHGDSLAQALNAGLQRLESPEHRTEEFDIPGWNGDMVVRVRKITQADRAQLRALKLRKLEAIHLALIGTVSVGVLIRPAADKPLEEITGGWRGVAAIMGNDRLSTSDVIFRCCDGGNPRAVEELFTEIDEWMTGRQSAIEQLLGE